jgi:hypothetical protein
MYIWDIICMKTIKCDSQETYRNKKTNMLYATKEDAQHDVNNPNTDTKQEDIVCDVKIIVPQEALSLVGKTKDEN